MKFDDFVKEVKSKKGIDVDGYYGKQCMDLYNYYCEKVLELKGQTGADCAKNILNNKYVLSNVKKIKNTLNFIPQKGDIAVWTKGKYGHVAICLGQANLNTFKTLDQNWVPQTLTEEVHNYTYMAPLYFLRPLNQKNIKDVVVKPKATKYKVTALIGLNIRAGAGTKYKKVGGYKYKTIVEVTEIKNGWGKTNKGWISLTFCKKV